MMVLLLSSLTVSAESDEMDAAYLHVCTFPDAHFPVFQLAKSVPSNFERVDSDSKLHVYLLRKTQSYARSSAILL